MTDAIEPKTEKLNIKTGTQKLTDDFKAQLAAALALPEKTPDEKITKADKLLTIQEQTAQGFSALAEVLVPKAAMKLADGLLAAAVLSVGTVVAFKPRMPFALTLACVGGALIAGSARRVAVKWAERCTTKRFTEPAQAIVSEAETWLKPVGENDPFTIVDTPFMKGKFREVALHASAHVALLVGSYAPGAMDKIVTQFGTLQDRSSAPVGPVPH